MSESFFGSSDFGSASFFTSADQPDPGGSPAPLRTLSQLRVEMAISPAASGFRLNHSRLGQGRLADDLGRSWVDVTGDIDADSLTSIRRSVSRQAGAGATYDGGTFSTTLHNGSGDYDPTNQQSPYWAGGTRGSNIRPGVPLRASIRIDGEDVRLFTGWVDDWPLDYTDSWSVVRVEAFDARERIHNANLEAVAVAEGDGDTAERRVDRILDRIGWGTVLRDIQSSVFLMGPTTMEDEPWSEIAEVAISDMGLAWVDRHGRVKVRSRNAFPRSPDLVLGPGGLANYRKVALSNGKARVVNHAKLRRRSFADGDRPGENAIYRETDPEIGFRTWSFSSLWVRDDRDVQKIGSWAVSQFGDVSLDVREVAFEWDHGQDPAVLRRLASIDIGDRHTIRVARPDGSTFDRDLLITGVAWEFRGISDFAVRFQTGVPPKSGGDFRLNQSQLNRSKLALF